MGASSCRGWPRCRAQTPLDAGPGLGNNAEPGLPSPQTLGCTPQCVHELCRVPYEICNHLGVTSKYTKEKPDA